MSDHDLNKLVEDVYEMHFPSTMPTERLRSIDREIALVEVQMQVSTDPMTSEGLAKEWISLKLAKLAEFEKRAA